MVLVIASVVAVLTLWRRRSGARARVGQYLLLVLVVLCAAGSIVMSMYQVRAPMGAKYVGKKYWYIVRMSLDRIGIGIKRVIWAFSRAWVPEVGRRVLNSAVWCCFR